MANGCCPTVQGLDSADISCASATPTCGCANGSTPFYNQTGLIQETHCQSTTVQQFIASLSLTADFVMPIIGQEGIMVFQGLAQIQIGIYLWNATYGYLVVTDFDPLSGEVTVMNEGQTGNAVAGTVIPRCTLFNVVGPPCDCD